MKTLCPLLLLSVLVAAPASAAVRVVTTLTDLGWAAREIGGEHVSVRSLCAPNEDPHYVTPTPSLVAAVGDADLFVEVGLGLELWTERLLDGAGNPAVRRGGLGHVLASQGVSAKQRPATLSRSQGDLHPDGNPHIWLDPVLMKGVVGNIADGLVRVDPAHTDDYRRRAADLQARVDVALYGQELVDLLGAPLLDRLARGAQLDEYLDKVLGGAPLRDRLGGWLGAAAVLRGRSVVYYHQNWVYFADRFGLTVPLYVEARPGIAPSAAHLKRVGEVVKAERVPLIVVTNFYDARLPQRIAQEAGIRVAVVPIMSGGASSAPGWFELMDLLVTTHVQAFGATP